ncbi:sulfotransferase [Pseudomonadota bacterium]
MNRLLGLENRRGFDPTGKNLIFVISQPRAGSTLLQRILSGNSQVQTAAEPWFMLHQLYALKDSGLQSEYDATLARDALKDFVKNCGIGEDTYYEAVRSFAGILYGNALLGSGKTIFLDKTPRYYFIIPELYRTFPNAQFVILLRNPLAVLFSIIKNWTNAQGTNLADFRNDLILAPRLLVNGIGLLGGNVIVMHYEHLVSAPEQAISSLCQQLEVPYEIGMLNCGTSESQMGRMGFADNMNAPLDPSTAFLHKWQALADSEQFSHFAIEYLDELGENLLRTLGYSYAELRTPFVNKGLWSKKILPWDIAIKNRSAWTKREEYINRRGQLLRNKGAIAENLSLLKYKIKLFSNTFRESFEYIV